MTEQMYPMREGDCSAGRHVIGTDCGWDTPCPAMAIWVVDIGDGDEGHFCPAHLQDLLDDGMTPEAVRQPVCDAGVRMVADNDPRWDTPCPLDALEVIAMTHEDGHQTPLWFCEGHFHEFKMLVGPEKLTWSGFRT